MQSTPGPSAAGFQRRACLVVPASSARKIAKAQTLDLDEVVIDLEDALAVAEKNDGTRASVASRLQETWKAPIRAVRVNAVDSPWFLDDVTQVASLAGPALGAIVLPKVESASDIELLDSLLDRLEQRGCRIAIEAQIESARALLHVEEIAAASTRLEALVFGPADFAVSLGLSQLDIGGIDNDYPGDQWAYPRARIAVAAHAYGLAPIDGPYGAYADAEGLRTSANRARLLGFVGKWAIHPNQVEVCRRVFAPSPDEVAQAQRILLALDEAGKTRQSVTSVDSSMVDEASRRAAESILSQAGIVPPTAAES